MGATEFMIIISALAGSVATLAGTLYRNERQRREKAEANVDKLTKIIIAQAAKENETIGEYARFLENQKGS